MAEISETSTRLPRGKHTRWVRVTHWIVTASFLVLVFSGVEILMVHPRLYWGEAGNDLTPPLVELPISRNYKHNGWETNGPFFEDVAGAPISASRTYDIFNQNGWGRSLHFLSGWFLVAAGVVYLLLGIFSNHLRRNIVPRKAEFSPASIRQDLVDHLRFRIPPATGGPDYGFLQKASYLGIVFLALPLAVITGLTMSPAVAAAFPFLLDVFGGHQSARTIHFVGFVALILFLLVHVAMTVRSGFVRQMRGMTLGVRNEE